MSAEDDGAVAIIGMSGRFPEASDVAGLWHTLLDGARAIRPLSAAELRAVDPAVRVNPGFVPVTAAVPDIDLWDAAFFGYSGRDAELMDPQHRLFLECAWEALEDAGYDPRNCPGVVGVLGGCGFPTYLVNNLARHEALMADVGVLGLAVGNERDTLTTKVSYALDLRGPSAAVQSACSTSLLAVHLACQSLLSFESDVMLAGGAAISVPQAAGYISESGSTPGARGEREHLALAPDGVCRSLDADGQGLVPGNGVGVVALKRAADAIRDGDPVYALILGSATNNDGVARVGFAAPGVRGQAEVMMEGLSAAGVPAETVSYLEVHGSGTLLGDSVELDAIGRTFTGRPTGAEPCVLGSVKANLGHLDRASGVTGLIKTALMLRHRTIPGQIDFATPNPTLDLTGGFAVVTDTRTWPDGAGPRRAAVNSFGLGGTNAFVVLQEAPPAARPAPDRCTGGEEPAVLVLSARTPRALEQATKRLHRHLEVNPEMDLADVAYTLQQGRTPFNVRCALVCADRAAAVAGLAGRADQRIEPVRQPRRDRPVSLLVPDGQAVPPDVATALYAGEGAFAEAYADAGRAQGLAAGTAPSGTVPEAVAGYALGTLLLSWGIPFADILGVGTGARVAACLAGRLPLAALSAAEPLVAEADPVAACADPDRIVVELGDGRLLAALGHGRPEPGCSRLAALPQMAPEGARVGIRQVLGDLWLAGANVDWSRLQAGRSRRRVSLPTYPFQRERFWIDPPARAATASSAT